ASALVPLLRGHRSCSSSSCGRAVQPLILSKNEIVDFPNEIQSLVCLEKLELNQNQIRVIPEGVFSHLSRLKHLRLNNNRLGALPRDLAACHNSLQYLNISNNLFRTFPQPVLQLARLQELHVQNNLFPVQVRTISIGPRSLTLPLFADHSSIKPLYLSSPYQSPLF
uniref:Uncharacterized protein n=1 Tax=Otus sunia TaxID=257818 RepID=A0A8C8E673_9STRI